MFQASRRVAEQQVHAATLFFDVAVFQASRRVSEQQVHAATLFLDVAVCQASALTGISKN